ncbi:DSD1 family PLP-dependent enzyme [Steroidobacter sp. S1-65]|uniref:DSD1 family PLP-dependent enzyme n=1 Tax=Steroidobacter gossypii TaxID=2805490 RepID=A0ABS1X1E1_9GAMM|nr:DSD1 family PLP-dependent enzyme [Steroidobacter gossypii]MBM0107060.1 DSD1 family PLP-dependent enzyme [Steroidobacter gossypii]
MTASDLLDLDTPSLLLDEQRMERNIRRLQSHLSVLRVPLRPHLKTAKSIEIAQRLMRDPSGPATVSTLQEAEAFADAGVRDLLYAVGIAPGKLPRVVALRRRGVDLSVILDSLDQARAVAAACSEHRMRIPVLIEIDSDGHRAGVQPGDPLLIEVGRVLHEGGADLRGVMTHAGGSYGSRNAAELENAAEQERAAVMRCAEELRAAGLPAPVVSVGSTPTAHFARRLDGVTEVRAGVFVFMDLVMAGIGVCSVDDIAISVLAAVIGHRPDKNQLLVDAGWMALSRDRGTASQAVDWGYGRVCDIAGRPIGELMVSQANQEHGIIESREPGSPVPALPIGTRVRILPNHACATAAQHLGYVVLRDGAPVARWPRIPSGW